MKYHLTLLLSLSLFCLPLAAQERTIHKAPAYDWTQHRHSLEITTGLPLGGLVRPGGNRQTVYQRGQDITRILPTNLNITYSYRFARRWDLAVTLNTEGYIFRITQYPQNTKDGYDWSADPVYSRTEYNHRGVWMGIAVKYYWKDDGKIQLYSGLGGAMMIDRFFGGYYGSLLFLPQLTPFGVHRQFQHWYILGELSAGYMGLGLLAGAGYRF